MTRLVPPRFQALLRGSLVSLLCGAGLLLAGGASGNPFYMNGNEDPTIPTPESVLGFTPGDRFTPHHLIVEYLEALAAASPRVNLERYGETHEGRPLLLLTISAPGNMNRLEKIRDTYAKLADPRNMNLGEARGRSRDVPVAVWLSYNIHGNEASSSEAALAVAYHLAAATDPETAKMLEETVVLLDPCLNPDGRDRYVNWIRSVMGSNPDPDVAAREHHEPWPGGRFNHYLFDLNRDWAWLTQQETRARAKVYRAWRPQVHVDLHEMWPNATYFFFPPERPVHPLYPPQVMKWAEIFGRGNAEAFDARGWRYYTSESFDLYYPGYGDSWPTFQGAVGMTYEQAGHGLAGEALELGDGRILTLAERSEHHYTASLATIRTAAANREARLLDFHRFFESSSQLKPDTYLFPPGDDPPRTAQLVALLMEHGAEVYRAREQVRSRGMRNYDGKPVSDALPEGTWVVPLDQPLHRFLRAVLEPEAALPDTFFYDVSAWSLPLAFGIEAYYSEGRLDGRLERITQPPRVTGKVIGAGATYAWLISWQRNGAPQAAAWLQKQGVRVHFSTREIRIGDRVLSAGSLVLFRGDNPDSLEAWLNVAADRFGVDVLGVNSGLTDEGPDLGSGRIRYMKPMRVAVVAGEPASPTSVGSCWYLLDKLYDIPHSLLRIEDLSAQALEDYDVLVFPDDWSGGRAYQGLLGEAGVETLKDWVRAGGVFVGLGGGAFFATEDISGLSSVSMAPSPDEDGDFTDEEKLEREKSRRMETREERERRERLESLPGSIFRISVDRLHPLGFGYREEARVLKISENTLDLGPPGTNVALFTPSARVSGYATPEAESRLEDRPFLVDEPVGRGHVVMYVEDPNFRLFWYGLTRLFLNSIFFLPSIGG